MADSYPLFSIFAFCGFVAGLVPFAWHLQAWNAATCAYMLWTSLSSLIYFVDSIVWHHSINDPSPVWCDICEFTDLLLDICLPHPCFRSHEVPHRSSNWCPRLLPLYQ